MNIKNRGSDPRYGKPQKKRIKEKHKTQWKATSAD
jgi:hypothetical protein